MTFSLRRRICCHRVGVKPRLLPPPLVSQVIRLACYLRTREVVGLIMRICAQMDVDISVDVSVNSFQTLSSSTHPKMSSRTPMLIVTLLDNMCLKFVVRLISMDRVVANDSFIDCVVQNVVAVMQVDYYRFIDEGRSIFDS